MLTMPKISPDKQYSLSEIIEMELIPQVHGSQTLYKLVTEEAPDGHKPHRVPATKTTQWKVKPVTKTRPGSKIQGRYYVAGSELLKFLKLNGM